MVWRMRVLSMVISGGMLLGCLGTRAQAIGNIHLGALELHPFASVSYQSNNNIFSETRQDRNDDKITKYTIGADLKTPLVARKGDDFMLNVRYLADIINFHRYDNQDRTDHTVNARVRLNFVDRVVLTVRDNFRKTADPPNSELTALESRMRNAAGGKAELRLRNLGLSIGYDQIKDNYDKTNTLDKDEVIITPVIRWDLSPKTSLFVEYNDGEIDYINDAATTRDSNYTQWRAGVQGRLAPKLTGIIKVGQKDTEYNDARTITAKDFTGTTVFGNLTYRVQKRSTLALYGNRTSEESTFGTSNYFTGGEVGLKADHQLMRRLFLVADGSYRQNKYPEMATVGSKTEKRNDYVRRAIGGLRYEIKEWLSVESSYEWKEKDSNFNAFDYDQRLVTGKISMIF